MEFVTPSQNRPKFNFSVGVINLSGIPVPTGIQVKREKFVNSQGNSNSHGICYTKSKFDFSVGVINPMGIPVPKGIKVKVKKTGEFPREF